MEFSPIIYLLMPWSIYKALIILNNILKMTKRKITKSQHKEENDADHRACAMRTLPWEIEQPGQCINLLIDYYN